MGYALPRQRIVNWFSSRKKKMLLACEVYLEFLIKLHSLGFLFYQHLPHRGQLGREFGGTRFASQAWREEEAAAGTE